MIEITGALTAARALAELAKVAIDARDDAKAKGAIADLQSKLFDATSAALAMAEKASALQTALSEAQREKGEIEAKLSDRASYALHEIRPGAFVYAAKAGGDGAADRPAHYLCQPCYDKGIKAILRFAPARPGANALYLCPEGGNPHALAVPGTSLPHPPPIRSAGTFGRQS